MEHSTLVAAASAVLALSLPPGASSQQADNQGQRDADTAQPVRIEQLVVTARQREEDPQDVPFALTILDSEALVKRRIDDSFSFFRQVPGLSLTSFDDGRFAYFQLRGIGPLTQAIGPDDGSVVTYVDGIPQPVFASEFAYLDLERIEVLRGPQGTLFGRNSQGGVINVATRAPSQTPEGRMRIEGGEQGYGLVEGSLSGPLAGERIRGRLSLRASTLDGYIDNTAPQGNDLGDKTVYAGRGVLTVDPATDDGYRLKLAINADHRIANPFYYVLRNQSDALVEIDPENEVERTTWGVSLQVDKPLPWANFTSITAFNGFRTDQFLDDTNGLIYGPLFGAPSESFLSPLDFSDWQEDEARLFQEFRLSNVADNDVAWTTGIVYFRSDLEVELDNRSSFSPVLNGDRDATQVIDSYAAYGEITAPFFNPRLEATAGVRYTRDEKTLDATFVGVGFPGSVGAFQEESEADFDFFTGRLGLTFEASSNATLYATVARGAKSGGFPRLTLNAAFGVDSPAYRESTSWTYEAGMKARLMDGRARIDLAGFYNDVEDEQLFLLDLVAFQFVPVSLDTRAYGIEAQGELALNRRWSLAAGLAWTEGEIEDRDAFSGASPGNPIPNVAALSTTATIDYRGAPVGSSGAGFVPFMTLTHQYVSERSVDVADSFDLDAYHNIDFRLGADLGRVELYAFARNLLDEEQEINGVLFGPGVGASSLGQPRVIGIGLTSALR